MEERLKIKVWPIGEERSYVQVMNPELLFEESLYDGPVEIMDHRQRYGDGLLQIKENALKMINDYREQLMGEKMSEDYANGLGLTGMCGGLICTVMASICINPLIFFAIIPAAVGGEYGGATIGERFDEKNNKKIAKKLAKHTEAFEGMPTSQYVHRIDPELQNIYETIEGNGKLEYFSGCDLEAIKGLLDGEETRKALTQSAISVYQQKLTMAEQRAMPQTKSIMENLDYRAMWQEDPGGFKKYFAELDDARKERVLTEIMRERVENTELEEWLSKEWGEVSKKVARNVVMEK